MIYSKLHNYSVLCIDERMQPHNNQEYLYLEIDQSDVDESESDHHNLIDNCQDSKCNDKSCGKKWV